MGDIAKLATVLFMISAAAGLAVSFTYKQTKEKIALEKKFREEQALQEVLPEGTSIKKREKTPAIPGTYWAALKDSSIIGYAFKGSAKGYSSTIEFLVGINPEGTILGLTILSQEETPGLGARVKETVSKKYLWNGLLTKRERDTPWFTKQFKGIDVTKDISLDHKSPEWHKLSEEQKKSMQMNNTITAITGATISTEAIKKEIKKVAYAYFSALKEKEDVQLEPDPLTTSDEE